MSFRVQEGEREKVQKAESSKVEKGERKRGEKAESSGGLEGSRRSGSSFSEGVGVLSDEEMSENSSSFGVVSRVVSSFIKSPSEDSAFSSDKKSTSWANKGEMLPKEVLTRRKLKKKCRDFFTIFCFCRR